MENLTSLLAVVCFMWAMIYVFFRLPLTRWKSTATATARLPPGPYPFPVIGNILALGKSPHESLRSLSKIYGPLMSLKMGSLTTVVVSSPETAREVLQKHDQVFSSRTIPPAAKVLSHHKVSIAWLPASGAWRIRRKICKEHLFSVHCLNASQGLRQKKVQELLDFVQQSCRNCQAVDVGKAAFTTSLNLISNTLFSSDMAHHGSDSSQEFKDFVRSLMEIVGRPNVADYFPVLRSIDPQGINRETHQRLQKIFTIFDGIINQRMQARASETSPSSNSDVLDALLNLTKENDTQLRCSDIKNFLLDFFIAGSDTTSSTVEWAMAELLQNPQKLAKAQAEVREVIGRDGEMQESDITRLPYLQALVKETLRLHPPGPLLIPHKAEADVEVAGFIVPKNAQVLVNVWAIGRDPENWTQPDSFLPERFLGQGIDYTGRDFEFIPFGSGRRMCPGLPLAHRMVPLMLGSLLYCFDWKLEDGNKPGDIDMGMKFGLTLQKAIPLEAVPVKRMTTTIG